MSKGKFSQPRPYRDEEREIEQAFRQVTGQAPEPEPAPPSAPEEYMPLDEKFFDLEPEESVQFRQDMPEMPQRPQHYAGAQPPEDPDFFDKVRIFSQKAAKYCRENPKIVMVSLCAVALVMIIGFMAAFFLGTSDPYGGKILNNVYLGDVNVGGLTKNEAQKALKTAANQGFDSQDMIIDLAGTPLRMSPKDTKVSLDVKGAVNAAFEYGRSGSRAEQDAAYQASLSNDHFIGLLPYLKLDQAYIHQALTNAAKDTGSTLTQTTYGLEGNQPMLQGDKFDENAPCQTLVITMGTPGVGFDPEAVLKQVLDAYSMNTFLVKVEQITAETEPTPIDLDAIYREVYIEPVDASVDLQTFEPLPGSYGYGFDLEAARKQVENAQYGEIVRIPMEYIKPNIIGTDVLYRDVLGEYTTKTGGDKNRSENLRLACEAINGTVVNPGEEFSFNKTVGEPTSAKGYRFAPDQNKQEGNTLGGGIDQVASTLYYTAMLADLSVTDRTNNDFVPDYIDRGFDAAIVWKKQDFKFKNSTGFPIKIQAEASGSSVTVKLLGTDEKDYTIKLEAETTETLKPKTDFKEYPVDNEQGYEHGDTVKNGVTGYRVKTYKCKYDKATGDLLTKDYETSSEYKSVNKVVAVVKTPAESTEPSTEATTEPTEGTEGTKPTDPSKPTETPPASTEAPPSTTEAPPATTEAPPATTEAPPATTEAPKPPETQTPPPSVDAGIDPE